MLALQDHEMFHGLENPFQCNTCGEKFDRYSTLKSHQQIHDEMDCACSRCGKNFANLSQLKKHEQLHEQTGLAYMCEVCSKLFESKEAHALHMKMHNKERHHVCDICNLSFLSSGGLNRHRKVHKRMDIFNNDNSRNAQDLRCSHCHANFTYESSLKKHLNLVHNIGNLEEEADVEALTLPLSEDRVVEELQEKLNEGYAPKNSELYDVPAAAETLESKYHPVDPFRCGICEESFTDVDMLCDHFTNCHTSDQSFYCDLCGVGCSSEDQMDRHKLVHSAEEQQSLIKRGGSDDLPNVCSICGKGYKTTQELNKHSRIHNFDKRYKCNSCTASFPIKSALDKHLLVHTGERPFKCDVCLKSFRQSAALVRHKLWTHRLKNQNKCEICSKTFFTSTLLLYHLDVHGEQGRALKMKIKEVESMSEDIKDDNEEESPNGFRDVEKENMSDNSISERERNIDNKCEYCLKCFPSYVALLTHKLTHKLSASYKCDLCHRTFREKRYLQKHKMTHRGVRSWKCDICFKGFAAKLTLIRHSQVHIREALKPSLEGGLGGTFGYNENGELVVTNNTSTLPTELRCNECNIDYVHRSHYVRHKLLHSGTPLLKCGLCDKMFVHKSDIIRHKVMHSFMFTCDVCGRNFHKRSLYILHKRKHVDEKPFKCNECFKSFSSSSNYNAHLRIHSGDKPFKCDRCNYRCSQSGRLMKHKRMHTGVKPFKCSICDKFFANAESRKIHERLHTGDRPFKCDVCDKSFVNSGSLTQHKRDHMREEKFKCDLCHHKFRREAHLIKHKMYHEQQRADPQLPVTLYMCEVCGRVFDKKKYLYTHGNVHSRQKNYTCPICKKQLASRLALKNHGYIHTGRMPYKCNYCHKEFRSSSNLKRHLRVHDGQELFTCSECKDTFLTQEDLNVHRYTCHHHVMVADSVTPTVIEHPQSGDDPSGPMDNNTSDAHAPTQLYVFESMTGDIVGDSQQLLVNDGQQQLFVDGSQSLLVFPDNADGQFSAELQSVNSNRVVEDNHTTPSADGNCHENELSHVVDLNEHDLADDLSRHQLDHQEASASALESEDIEIAAHDSVMESIVTNSAMEHTNNKVLNLVSTQEEDMVEEPRETEIAQISHNLEIENRYLPKQHQCTVCFKVFAKRQYLTKHMYRHRVIKPHQCDVCGKGFAQKFEVVVHKIKHTGIKPYTCDICHRQFRSKVNLNNHKMRHKGEYPFMCSVCGRGFSTQLQLERHVTLHTGELLPFSCQICRKGYSIRLNLEKHMAKAHNQPTRHPSIQRDEALHVDINSLSTHDQRIQIIDHEGKVPSGASHSNRTIGQITIKNQQELMENIPSSQTIYAPLTIEAQTSSEVSFESKEIAHTTTTSSAAALGTIRHYLPQQRHVHNEGNGVTRVFELSNTGNRNAQPSPRTIDIGEEAEVYHTFPHLITSVSEQKHDDEEKVHLHNQEGQVIIRKQQSNNSNTPAPSEDVSHTKSQIQIYDGSQVYDEDTKHSVSFIEYLRSINAEDGPPEFIHSGVVEPKILQAILQDAKQVTTASHANTFQRVAVETIVAHDDCIEEEDDNRTVMNNSQVKIISGAVGEEEFSKINVENISVAASDDESDSIINVVSGGGDTNPVVVNVS